MLPGAPKAKQIAVTTILDSGAQLQILELTLRNHIIATCALQEQSDLRTGPFSTVELLCYAGVIF